MKTYEPVAAGAQPTYANTRAVYVIDDLSALSGPVTGVVTLPLHLDWSMASAYDLARPQRVRTLYATVLREATSESDLIEFLDARLLADVWPDLNLPTFVRTAWEDIHPELRWR
ncbi:MAG: hypothetical protein ACRDTJ_28455 [Pseudonocardiaceae bacterium]